MPRPVLGESCTTSIKDFAIFTEFAEFKLNLFLIWLFLLSKFIGPARAPCKCSGHLLSEQESIETEQEEEVGTHCAEAGL